MLRYRWQDEQKTAIKLNQWQKQHLLLMRKFHEMRKSQSQIQTMEISQQIRFVPKFFFNIFLAFQFIGCSLGTNKNTSVIGQILLQKCRSQQSFILQQILLIIVFRFLSNQDSSSNTSKMPGDALKQLDICDILMFFYCNSFYKSLKMHNRNMNDNPNFEGKHNVKVSQAPGGSSSLSLAWSNEKTDYGPQRTYKKPNHNQSYEQPYRQPERHDYSQPIKLMEEAPQGYGYRNPTPSYQQGQQQIGGEHGYSNYGRQQPEQPGNYGQMPSYNSYGSYRGNTVDQLDIAVQEHKSKNQRPPSVPKQDPALQGRSSVKINGPPRQNNIFGGNEYNYWKSSDNTHAAQNNSKPQYPSEKRINQYADNYREPNYVNSEKTSVKVHNPPGGKQTFTFG